MDEPLLTPRQAWEFLQVGRTTLYRLTKEGRIPAIRIGKLLRFRKEDLIALKEPKSDETRA